MFAPRSGLPLALSGAVLAGITGGVLVDARGLLLPALAAVAVGWALWAFLLVFFRDPDRPTGAGIVAAADGRIQLVERGGGRVRVATFMNVTDVHVNRFPLDGAVLGLSTEGAGHRPAYRADAHHNHRRHYRLETEIGEVEVVQMTGILARRLVSLVRVGDRRGKGERLGMILLGSRVDVLLPEDRVVLRVQVGDRVRAGSTTIAEERT